jgi:2-hydroxychromene-2-carboxylate isomerase
VAGAACAGDDALFADPARLEDPQVWARAQRLALDLQRFDADRRSEAARARVQRDFRSGVRAGVVTTPTLFVWEDGAARRVGIDELDPSRRRAGE